MTPGAKTSEFWLTLGTIVAATILTALKVIGPEVWAAVVLGGSGAYTASRAVVKRNIPTLDEGP